VPVEIIGMLPHRRYTEVYADPASTFDMEFMLASARAHEASGFDRVLIANTAVYPDNISIATWVAAHTTALKLMIAHRPGFIAPTMAGRMLATVDQLSGGRCGVHIITGTQDIELQSDGDFLTKEVRYARSAEYVKVMRKEWTSAAPFDHAGEFYKANGAFAAVKPVQPTIPVFWGGSSDKAVEMGARVADIYALQSLSVDKTRAMAQRVRAEAARHGRRPEVLVSTRVIIGKTEAEAWETAHGLLRHLVEELHGQGKLEIAPGESVEAAMQRAMDESMEGSRDGVSWTALGKIKVGRPLANCLVGSADQILGILCDYYDAGVTRFILGGYDPLGYQAQFGRELLPQLRAAVDERDARGQTSGRSFAKA
jgi:alkanesulfonate monooxygenase